MLSKSPSLTERDLGISKSKVKVHHKSVIPVLVEQFKNYRMSISNEYSN